MAMMYLGDFNEKENSDANSAVTQSLVIKTFDLQDRQTKLVHYILPCIKPR